MKTVISEIHQFRSLRSFQGRQGILEISLDLPGQPPFAKAVEEQINNRLKSCGCGTGAVFLACGLGFLAVSPFLGYQWAWSWALFGKVLGFLLSLAAIGKITGLLWAEIRFRSALRKMEDFYGGKETAE